MVTDTQWAVFCREFDEPQLAADARLGTNGDRVREREWLIPRLGDTFRRYGQDELAAKLEAIGLPFAPIAKPWDLFDDPHLNASGGFVETRVADGMSIKVPALPIELDGERLPKRSDPPAIGEGAREVLRGLGYSEAEVEELAAAKVIALP